ncbi:MAG TPA: DUF4097 family beta strand repeat-containing protein [Vicinamibacteria bacterium]|nr:DUF4097 family beta strand repeat-containing protein [Vicinamibacteria bacterium]
MSLKPMLTLGLFAAALVAPAFGADFHWQGKVAAGATVEIKGVNGGIDASAAPGSDVEVTAVKHARHSDPAEVEIKVVEHEGGVTICAVYPSPSSTPNECQPGAAGRMNTQNNDTSVDFTVKVPASARFVGRTVNGGIQAESLSGDAEAHTVNGGIKVQAGGHIQAETVNGGILASLGRATWTGALAFKTVNGGITLDLPADAGVELKAETVNGDITSDFPLTVQGRLSKRRISATIGSGGRQLSLSTVNGGIQIRKGS